jgi:hypothetical protein
MYVLYKLDGRWHLTDFGPLCNDCIGYNAVDATIDAYLDHDVSTESTESR